MASPASRRQTAHRHKGLEEHDLRLIPRHERATMPRRVRWPGRSVTDTGRWPTATTDPPTATAGQPTHGQKDPGKALSRTTSVGSVKPSGARERPSFHDL